MSWFHVLLSNSTCTATTRSCEPSTTCWPTVGRCRLTLGRLQADRAWFQRLNLICDEPPSNSAFIFLRALLCDGRLPSTVTVVEMVGTDG